MTSPIRDRSLRVALLLAMNAALPQAASAQEQRPTHVYLAVVQDRSGQSSIAKMRQALEAALEARPGMRVMPNRPWIKAVAKHRIPPGRWLDPFALRRLTQGLALDAVLKLSMFRRGRGAYQALLSVYAPATGENIASLSIDLARPRLNASEAERLAGMLVKALAPAPPQAAAEEAPETTPEEPPGQPAVGTATLPEEEPTGDLSGGAGEPTPARTEQQPDAGESRETAGSTPADTTTPAAGAVDESSETRDDWGMADGWEAAEDLAFADVDVDEILKKAVVEIGGRASVEHFGYFQNLGSEKNAGRNAVDLALRVKAGVEKAAVTGTFLVRHDFSEHSRDRLEAEEIYLDVGFSIFELRLGRSLVTWGTANVFNPTDIINPRDYRDPLEQEKVGVWLARASLIFDPILIEAYYLPVHQPHMIPLPEGITPDGEMITGSRWLTGNVGQVSPIPLAYHMGEAAAVPTSFENVQFALRLAGSVWGMDFSFAYAYLFDRLPTVRSVVSLDSPMPDHADVDIDVEYLRIHAATFDFETVIGSLRLAAQALVVITEDIDGTDDEVDNPYLKGSTGFDYRTPQFLEDHSLLFYANFTITQALVGSLPGDFFSRLKHPLRLAVAAGVSYEVGSELTITLQAIEGLRRFGLLINPEIEYVFRDTVALKLGCQILLGEENRGLFGLWQDNTRMTLAAEANF